MDEIAIDDLVVVSVQHLSEKIMSVRSIEKFLNCTEPFYICDTRGGDESAYLRNEIKKIHKELRA